MRQMMLRQLSTTDSLSNYSYDQQVFRHNIMEWLVRKILTFLTVDNRHFKHIIQATL